MIWSKRPMGKSARRWESAPSVMCLPVSFFTGWASVPARLTPWKTRPRINSAGVMIGGRRRRTPHARRAERIALEEIESVNSALKDAAGTTVWIRLPRVMAHGRNLYKAKLAWLQ